MHPQIWERDNQFIIEGYEDLSFSTRVSAMQYYVLHLEEEKKNKRFWRWSTSR
jgi:hypothetical protein